MKVLEVTLSQEAILALPEETRTFFLTASHVTNELNALSKFAIWSAKEMKPGPEEHGQITNILLFLRLLAGKLNEAWEFYRSAFFAAKLSKKYEPKLNEDASQALQYLKKYFGRSNFAHLLRNSVGFHYSPQEINASLTVVKEPLVAYLDNSGLPNNLFFYAEQLVLQAIVSLLELNESQNPMLDLTSDLFEVASKFIVLADGLLEAIIIDSEIDLRSKPPVEVELSDLPKFKSVSIAWFSDTS